jgi:LPXTG-motif cell wall-anchored protein
MSYPSRRLRLVTAAAAVTALAVFAIAPGAKAAALAAASAFGANVQVGGQDVVAPTPAVSVATAPGDATDTVIDIPGAPVLVNGTLTATANVHPAANIPTGLTVNQQSVAGPYNGRGLAQIEGASVLYGVAGAEVPLLSAAVIRSEAAVVCGATPRYTANSEIIDLSIAGNSVPLNAPVEQLIDAISGVLTTSGLNAVADVQRNVVTQIAGGGVGVDALVVTVLSAAGDTPLAQVRLAHSEVTAAACAAKPQCSDGIDNDGDAAIDTADPGCHTDGNAANAATYVPTDNDETNDAARAGAAVLPRTGSETGLPLATAGLVSLATLGLRLRRRLVG